MNLIPNPEYIDEDNPEWSNEMFAQARPMVEADPVLVAMSLNSRDTQQKLNGMVRLESDVAKFFPDTEAVNEALRFLIRMVADGNALPLAQA